MRFFDRLHGVAVGEFGNIVRTTDGGTTWQTIQPQGSGQRLWDVEFVERQYRLSRRRQRDDFAID